MPRIVRFTIFFKLIVREIKGNMNPYRIRPIRLLKAIWFLGTFVAVVFLGIWIDEHSGLCEYIKSLQWGDNEDSLAEYQLIFIPMALYEIYSFIKGTNYFMTMNLESGPGDGNIWGHWGDSSESDSTEYPGIAKALNYRNTQLQNSDNTSAQEIFKSTAWVDGLLQNSKGNPGLTKTIRFLDTSFKNMDNQSCLDFMQNKKK
jgi:hypothetical protein